VDLNTYLSILRRRWLPVFICLVIGFASALAITAATERTYRATTRLFLNIPVAAGVQEALQGVQLSSQLLESYAEIATSRRAATAIAEGLGEGTTAAEVRRQLSARTQPDTLLIDLTVRSGDREEAIAIADGAAATLVATVAELEAGRGSRVEARVIDAATAGTAPVSPRPARNLAAGVLLGLLAGVVVAFVLDALLRDEEANSLVETARATPAVPSLPPATSAQVEELRAAIAEVSRDLGALAQAVGDAKRTTRTRRAPTD
jgi:capsular polysaccharide biosynthesis protein